MCISACQEFGLIQEMLWVLGIIGVLLKFEVQLTRKRVFSCVCVKTLVLSRPGVSGDLRKHASSQLLLISPSQFLFLNFLRPPARCFRGSKLAFECEGGRLVPLGGRMQAGLQTLHDLIRSHTAPPASPQVDWHTHMVLSLEWAGQ